MKKIILLLALSLIGSSFAYAEHEITITDAAPNPVGRYEKFEVTFDIKWKDVNGVYYDPIGAGAINPYWPYDPNPAANTLEHPSAVPAGVGVSVDGLFLPPGETGWNNAVRQPGFCYQEYVDYVGLTDPSWRIRFAPTDIGQRTAIGQWTFKIVVQDASGSQQSSSYTFTCVVGGNPGFIRVSPTDNRYFELNGGKYIPLVGIADADTASLPSLAAMGINLIRPWWQGKSVSTPLFGGVSGWHNLTYSDVEKLPGSMVSAVVPNDNDSNPWRELYCQPAVQPNRNYRFSAIVKTVGITGTEENYGVRLYSWPGWEKSARLTGENNWRNISVDVKSSGPNYLTIAIGQENVTGGIAYCGRMSLKEILPGGGLGKELLLRNDFQSHTVFNPVAAKDIDEQLDTAKSVGVYVKAVIEEKGDSFYGSIQDDGTWGPRSDDNVYANETHASRTYQTYYWRYLIARYGYSTALHSIEFVNEGSPNSAAHAEATASLSRYFKQNDPNHRLVSTSNWFGFPPSMWLNPDIDIADIHRYLGFNIPSGGHSVLPGWDGNWSYPNSGMDPGPGFAFDNTVSHTGRRSLRITVPPVPGDDGNQNANSNLWFCAGAPPGHTLRFSMWFKGENLVTYNKYWISPGGVAIQYSMYGGDFAGYPVDAGGVGSTSANWGTYDWQLVEYTVTTPATALPNSGGRLPLIFWVQPYSRATNSSQEGYLWVDDFRIEDLTTGEVMNYNGGFEEVEFESYDVVAGHCAYSRILRGYGLEKPVIRGETGFCHPSRYGSPYKGFNYWSGDGTLLVGEDQALIDDTEGIYWRKWWWSQLDAGGLYEILWFTGPAISRNFTHAKSYQNFMSDIPLSNSNYRDAEAQATNYDIRVLGQKDLLNQKAHLWLDNAPYTWKAVVDHNFVANSLNIGAIAWSSTATYALGSLASDPDNSTRVFRSLLNNNRGHALTDVDWANWWEDRTADWWTLLDMASANPPLPDPVSGTVSVPGFTPDTNYTIEWWSTSAIDDPLTETTNEQIFHTETIQSDAQGAITFAVKDYTEDPVTLERTIINEVKSDVAVKIYPAGPPPDTTPPVISNVRATNITQTSATITWDTDESATSKVEYGLTDSYGLSVLDSTLVLNHSLALSGLTESTTYHFKVTSSDAAGNERVSEDYTFGTYPLTGRVSDRNSQPLPGALVRVGKFSNDNFSGSATHIADLTTDSNGNYFIPQALTRGAYSIIVFYTGLFSEYRNLIIEEGQSYEVNFTLREAPLFFAIIRNNLDQKRLEGVSITFRNTSTGEMLSGKTTDAQGMFRVYPEDNLPSGTYNILCAKAGFSQSPYYRNKSIPIPGSYASLYMDEVISNPASVSGYIREFNAIGLVGPSYRAQIDLVHKTRNLPYRTFTNRNGSFKISGLPSGEYSLTISKYRYISRSEDITLLPDENKSIQRLFTPSCAVSGTITDSAGSAISGSKVELLKEDGTPFKEYSSRTTSKNYGFTSDIPVATYKLRATASGYQTQEQTITFATQGEKKTVNFTLVR